MGGGNLINVVVDDDDEWGVGNISENSQLRTDPKNNTLNIKEKRSLKEKSTWEKKKIND